jgi:hypothetical protein
VVQPTSLPRVPLDRTYVFAVVLKSYFRWTPWWYGNFSDTTVTSEIYMIFYRRYYCAVTTSMCPSQISSESYIYLYILSTATEILFLKSFTFWSLMPYSPLKFNRGFGRTHRLHLHGRMSRARYRRENDLPPAFTLVPCSAYSSTKMEATFNGLHGVISQNTVLFITTGVRTSNPTFPMSCFYKLEISA